MFLRTIVYHVIHVAVFIDMVFTECFNGCKFCQDQTCMSCESSYFLSDGFCSKCPEDCTSCNSFDVCTSCKPNKHGLHARCTFNCPTNCLNGECQDDTGYCHQCNIGLYGLNCVHNCTFCADERCDLRKCSNGCREGYFEYKINVETICQQCPLDCRHCTDEKICYECYEGFHLYEFSDNVHCVLCSQGSQCSDYCVIQGCNECQIINKSLICTDCPEGQRFNGEKCESNTFTCSKECSTYCDSNGICQGECNDGWTGERCLVKCFERCLKCSKENGKICQQCKGDFYSKDCSLVCNSSCLTGGNHTCRISDGYCFNGCKPTFWDENCDKTCPRGCENTLCDRITGICSRGCKEGYTGDQCIQNTTRDQRENTMTTTTKETPLTTSVKDEGKVNIFIFGFFSGLGASAVIVVIAVLSYLIRRRYLARNVSRDNGRDIEIPTYYNTSSVSNTVKMQPANMINNYESLTSNRVNDKDYCDLGTTTQ